MSKLVSKKIIEYEDGTKYNIEVVKCPNCSRTARKIIEMYIADQ